jgi:hypothetical protein
MIWAVTPLHHTFSCGPGSLVSIATGYRLDGPGIKSWWVVRFSTPVQTGPGAHPASCTMDTGSFPGVNSGRSVMLTPHPFLVPWSWKSRAIPLWVVQPVQSLCACTKVHFTFLCIFMTSCHIKHMHYTHLATSCSQHWFRRKINTLLRTICPEHCSWVGSTSSLYSWGQRVRSWL